MKKIWMISAIASTLLCAQEITQESIAQQLESKKVKAPQESGFMPDLSLIVDVSYTNRSFDEDQHTDHLEIPGFVHGGGHDHGEHSHTEDDFEIEEAYATTRALPYHLQAKVGKFKSDFGYLNNKHHHNYNFSDTPLIYQSLLGDHGLNEVGAQLQYVMPLPVYVMVGIEALNGENEQSFGVDAFSPHDAPEDFEGVEKVSQPALWVGYLKSSFDVAGGTLLGGVSMVKGKSRIDHLEDEEGAHAFAGDTTLYGVDMVYKKYFAADHVLTWQSEYLYREMDGTQYVPNATEDAWANKITLKKEQAGFYSELVYQYDKNWRTGVRYSAITQNDITANGTAKDMPDDMYVTSAMLEYNPSEFSRLRLQYNHNSSLYNEEGEKNNKDELVLQFNYAIGAHGAHAF
jgi:hypothetical protein